MNEVESEFDLIVIGGGAAGFYGAIQTVEQNSNFKVCILEKSNKVLAKVKVSGGGRCNVTHHCLDPIELSHHYPRGGKFLKTVFKQHSVQQTLNWFSEKGVEIKTEEDGRMFPVTDDSQTIINCLMRVAEASKIKIQLAEAVTAVVRFTEGLFVHTATGRILKARKVLITTGGNSKQESYDWITVLGHTIISPIPSLFTFNDSEKKFTDLMGLSVPGAEVRIASTKFILTGPLLLTHWGLSGPAVIKLSAWAAEYLHQQEYNFTALVSWIGPVSETGLTALLQEQKQTRGKQKVTANSMFSLPQRLWSRLCELAEVDENKIWAELPQRNINKLMEALIRCPFKIRGKTTFKEEFVTCGGVDLKQVDPNTMQSKVCPNIYFAGEVLNIDGETGGFNFQNAWSTAFVAAKHIAAS